MIDWASVQTAGRDRDVLRLDCEESNVKLYASYYEGLGFVKVGTKYIEEWDYQASLYEKRIASN